MFRSIFQKRPSDGSTPPAEKLSPAQPGARQGNQQLMSRHGDSGFEEHFGSSPVGTDVSESLRSVENHLSDWYLQYGDIGYRIQREKEAQFHPCRSLAHQPQLTADARCKMVSWLISVHKHLHMSFECCCLAVNIMDRFLAATPVAADCFQLLGITALLLASKQVEVCSPGISHLLSLCCNAFTREQLCNLECLILVRLNFRLAAPTLAFFLDFYTNCLKSEHLINETSSCETLSTVKSSTERHNRCQTLAQRVCELSLADYAFNKYSPSLTACCALRLSNELLKTKFSHHGVTQSEERWDSCFDELFPSPGFGQACSSPQFSKAGNGPYKHSLAENCKEDLKLLVSLNWDSLELMSPQ